MQGPTPGSAEGASPHEVMRGGHSLLITNLIAEGAQRARRRSKFKAPLQEPARRWEKGRHGTLRVCQPFWISSLLPGAFSFLKACSTSLVPTFH